MKEEAYTLHLEPERKSDGRFKKGYRPWNKGLTWEQQGLSKEEKERRLKIFQTNAHRWKKGHKAYTGHPVIQYDDYGNRLHWYVSSEAAARKLGLHGRNIRKTCDGERQHCGGFRWAWDERFLT